jgi:hypothetical protein
MALPAPFVRPRPEDLLNLARPSSVIEDRPGQRKKIFVIKKTSRLPARNVAGKKIQRILIFDNHPDSLRLVFAGGANPYVDVARTSRTKRWEIAFLCLLLVGLCIAMFWPLF